MKDQHLLLKFKAFKTIALYNTACNKTRNY